VLRAQGKKETITQRGDASSQDAAPPPPWPFKWQTGLRLEIEIELGKIVPKTRKDFIRTRKDLFSQSK
jgi:hypothetical protein